MFEKIVVINCNLITTTILRSKKREGGNSQMLPKTSSHRKLDRKLSTCLHIIPKPRFEHQIDTSISIKINIKIVDPLHHFIRYVYLNIISIACKRFIERAIE